MTISSVKKLILMYYKLSNSNLTIIILSISLKSVSLLQNHEHVHEAGNKCFALHYSIQDTSKQKHTNIVHNGHAKWLIEAMERLIPVIKETAGQD